MVQFYYGAMFFSSLLASLLYAVLWRKHFDVHFTLMYIFIPIENLGYWLLCRSASLEAALTANKVIYIGASYLMLFIMLSVFSLCHVKLRRGVSALLISVNTLMFLAALTMGERPWFYSSASLEIIDGTAVLRKEYGPLHTVYYALIILYFSVTLGVLLHSYFRKKYVSKLTSGLLFLPELVTFAAFFGGRRIWPQIDLIPFGYVFAQVVFLFLIRRICLYDITDSGIDSLVETGDTGFVSFDLRFNYLGSNKTARQILPKLNALQVDRPISDPELRRIILPWLERFRKNQADDKNYYESNDHIYLADVNHLFDGSRVRGYQLFFTDDTASQKYIALLDSYNSDLVAEVARKTERIVAMHDKLVLSMATMVEGRDHSTGGHIRRTSDGVRILIGEIRRSGAFQLSEDFCRNVIKAAPMHDLGKITVDDAILRKPGRFTPEEFDKMKAHAAEGAKIVHAILEDTDDPEFQRVAENVAHYHHERWDGSGYPDGLSGEEIPLEARIMAVADVYDALVCKRVYKERMDFEQANGIMLEGMGKHFDPRLREVYLAVKPQLEQYYRDSE